MDEVELLIFESAWAKTSINRSGFTPAQHVLGRQPRVALDLASDDNKHYELAVMQDKPWTRASELRDAARKALMELDAKERIQRANRARPRRQLENQVFSEGQPVVVWRSSSNVALQCGSRGVANCGSVTLRKSLRWGHWRSKAFATRNPEPVSVVVVAGPLLGLDCLWPLTSSGGCSGSSVW